MKTSKADAQLVVDSWKRAEKNGLILKKKGFSTSEEGSESFVLNNAKQYQSESSKNALLSFEKNGVSYDNVDEAGTLIDRKYGHGSSIFKEIDNGLGEKTIIVHNQNRAEAILEQAERQVKAANGVPVKWEISTELGAKGIADIFKKSDNAAINNIKVEFVEQKKIIK